VSGIVLAGAARPPVNGGAVSDSRSSEIIVLMAMQTRINVLFNIVSLLFHKEAVATAAAAHRSAAGEALRGNKLTWNARCVLADGEASWAPRRPLTSIPKDTAKAFQPWLGDGQAVESEELRALGVRRLLTWLLTVFGI
jgi:hypothetical protein